MIVEEGLVVVGATTTAFFTSKLDASYELLMLDAATGNEVTLPVSPEQYYTLLEKLGMFQEEDEDATTGELEEGEGVADDTEATPEIDSEGETDGATQF